MSVRVIKECDRCGKDMTQHKGYPWPKHKYWINLPRFSWSFCYFGEVFTKKVDLCHDCWEEAKGFFYDWKRVKKGRYD